jgi:F0F1-type ATP synthase assembly protein I
VSKVSVGILVAALALIVAAVYAGASAVAGGGGVVMAVALVYSYVVARRETDAGQSLG